MSQINADNVLHTLSCGVNSQTLWNQDSFNAVDYFQLRSSSAPSVGLESTKNWRIRKDNRIGHAQVQKYLQENNHWEFGRVNEMTVKMNC